MSLPLSMPARSPAPAHALWLMAERCEANCNLPHAAWHGQKLGHHVCKMLLTLAHPLRVTQLRQRCNTRLQMLSWMLHAPGKMQLKSLHPCLCQ